MALIPWVRLRAHPLGSGRTAKGKWGMEMTHFTAMEWIDFVNQAASHGKHKTMQKHLESGCKRCTETAALWEKVRNTAAAEASYQPPAEALRIAKAAFVTAGLAAKRKETNSLIEVLFDSFLQPALAGARSASTGTRQMLYRADPYQIDVQIEAKPEGNRLAVTGQLLDVSHPEVVGRGVQVTISNRRGKLLHTVTNQFGEFSGEIDNSGDLELSFPGRDEMPIVISLRNALRQLPGGGE